MAVHVFSTLTAAVVYRAFVPGGADLPRVERQVRVEGGSNLPDKHLITPRGVLTTVSDEDYAWLRDDELFRLHQANGYIRVENKAADPEKVSADMEGRDQSAPLVEEDFAETEKPAETKPARRSNPRRA